MSDTARTKFDKDAASNRVDGRDDFDLGGHEFGPRLKNLIFCAFSPRPPVNAPPV